MTDFIGNILTQMSSAFNQTRQAEDLQIKISNDKTLKWRGLHNNQFAATASKKRLGKSSKTDEEDNDDNLTTTTTENVEGGGDDNDSNDDSNVSENSSGIKKVRYRTRNQVIKSEREKKENAETSTSVEQIIPKIEENDEINLSTEIKEKTVMLESGNEITKKIQRKRKKNEQSNLIEKTKDEKQDKESEEPKRRSRKQNNINNYTVDEMQEKLNEKTKDFLEDENKRKNNNDEIMLMSNNDEELEQYQEDTPTTISKTTTTILEQQENQQQQQKSKRGRKKKNLNIVTNELITNNDEQIVKELELVTDSVSNNSEQKILNTNNINNNNTINNKKRRGIKKDLSTENDLMKSKINEEPLNETQNLSTPSSSSASSSSSSSSSIISSPTTTATTEITQQETIIKLELNKTDNNYPELNSIIKIPKKRGRKPKNKDDNYEADLTIINRNSPVKKSQRIIKDGNFNESVLASAIARKEKINEQIIPQQRLSRRIKPTAKILANDELRYGFELQNNARLSLSSENLEQEEEINSIKETLEIDEDSKKFKDIVGSGSGVGGKKREENGKKLNSGGGGVTTSSQLDDSIKVINTTKNVPSSSSSTFSLTTNFITSQSNSLIRPSQQQQQITLPPPRKTCPDPEQFLNEIKNQKIGLHRSPEDNKKLNKKQQRRLFKLKEKHLEKLGLRKTTKLDTLYNNNNSTITTTATTTIPTNVTLATTSTITDSIDDCLTEEDDDDVDDDDDDNDEFVPYKKVQVSRTGVTLRLRRQQQQQQQQNYTGNLLDNKIKNKNLIQQQQNKNQGNLLMTFRKRKLNPNTTITTISSSTKTSAAATTSSINSLIKPTTSSSSSSIPGTSSTSSLSLTVTSTNNQQQQNINNRTTQQNNDTRNNENNCLCTVKSKYFVRKTGELTHCVAEDQIENNLVGCSNEINGELLNLLRPSIRVSYMILCESHQRRLLAHNCCAGCGIFCSQGKFAMCSKNHVFHRDCATKFILNEVGPSGCGKSTLPPTLSLKCPHCGLDVLKDEFKLILKCSNNSVFLPKHLKPARMSYDRKILKRSQTIRLEIEKMIPDKIFDILFKAENNLTLSFMNFTTKDLFYAVHNDNVERVAEIIGSGFDITTSFIEFQNGTCLHLVCSFGSLSMTYLILCRLSSNDFMNLMDNELRTPLMCSVIAEKHEILKLLIQCGADATLKGADGLTALHLASKRGNYLAAQILIDYHKQNLSSFKFKSFINQIDDGNWTSLVWAAENGFTDIVIYLINAEADVNICDAENNTALHWAALSNKIETVMPLLETNCDFNIQNVNGDTPLHISCRQSNTHICLILLAHGADLNIKNIMNETPYDCIPEDSSQCARTIQFNIQIRQIVIFPERKVLLQDISNGRETFPIKIIQLTNHEEQDEMDEPVLPDFRYITKSILLQNSVQIDRRVSQMRICSCADDCSSEHCQCSVISLQNWYTNEGRLKNDFNFQDPAMIFECNDVCGCNKLLCKNRVVQNGIKLPLEIFECNEKQKGWGVQSLIKIQKGSFIAEYTGEILTDFESERRTDDSYFFDLGSFDHCIDANFYGNVSRFFNHSCNPNIIPIRVYFDHQDLRFPKIAFFASKDIDINEEITFDYGEKFWIIKYKSFTCHCNTTECKYSKITITKTLEEYNQRNSSGSSL